MLILFSPARMAVCITVVMASTTLTAEPVGGSPGGGDPFAAQVESESDDDFCIWKTRLGQPLIADFEIRLDQWSAALSDLFNDSTPVDIVIDHVGLRLAGFDMNQAIALESRERALGVAIDDALHSHALTTQIKDRSLVITADFDELTRRGIADDRWVENDPDQTDDLINQMTAQTTLAYDEVPLGDVVASFAKTHDLPLVIDHIALEDHGLSDEMPITLQVHQVSAGSALREMLRPFDLVLMVKNERLVITTPEPADEQLMMRLYFLEGFGFEGDYRSMFTAIQTTIEPDTWERLGGMSTMTKIEGAGRPCLLVGTTLSVHQKIEELFAALRSMQPGTWGMKTPGSTADSSIRSDRPAEANLQSGGMF